MTLLNLFRRTPSSHASNPQLDAAKRLERIVQETRDSYECEQFRRRRAAAKLGWARKGAA